MTILVPIAMFGWIIVSIVAFRNKEPCDAAILVVVGGVLFLPMFSFELPLLPTYDKISAIAWSLVIGELFSGKKRAFPVERSILDLPVMMWCFVSPVFTSLSNGLGVYNGLSNLVQNYLGWWVSYWMGRRYFNSGASLRKLTLALVAGGLLYFPLMAFEVRMSPQLSRMVYGFFPHSFLQHMRYGGFRPIVFMQHGLMVALWSGASAMAAYWLWRSGAVTRIKGIPMALAALVMIGGTILCKSYGAMILMAFGIALYSVFKKTDSTRVFRILLLFPILYIGFRISNILPISTIERVLVRYFDAERVQSALMRMTQEELFGARASLRPILGWGGFNRGWPIDPATGRQLIAMIDALWTILYSSSGMLGLISVFVTLGIGPMMVIRSYRGKKACLQDGSWPSTIDGIILSLVLIIFILDCLLNSLINTFYILCAGALVSHALRCRAARASAVPLVSDSSMPNPDAPPPIPSM